jgi:hypothetical protein
MCNKTNIKVIHQHRGEFIITDALEFPNMPLVLDDIGQFLHDRASYRAATATDCARRIGTTGCEILDADGSVVAWTADVGWASMIAAALNGAGFPRSAPCHHSDGGIGPVEANHGRGDRWAESAKVCLFLYQEVLRC